MPETQRKPHVNIISSEALSFVTNRFGISDSDDKKSLQELIDTYRQVVNNRFHCEKELQLAVLAYSSLASVHLFKPMHVSIGDAVIVISPHENGMISVIHHYHISHHLRPTAKHGRHHTSRGNVHATL